MLEKSLCEMDAATEAGASGSFPPEKCVLVLLGERRKYDGGESSLAKATMAVYSDVLQPTDKLIFQLHDEDWGGLLVDVLDSTQVPDKSVLKAIVDSVRLRTIYMCVVYVMLSSQFLKHSTTFPYQCLI